MHSQQSIKLRVTSLNIELCFRNIANVYTRVSQMKTLNVFYLIIY